MEKRLRVREKATSLWTSAKLNVFIAEAATYTTVSIQSHQQSTAQVTFRAIFVTEI